MLNERIRRREQRSSLRARLAADQHGLTHWVSGWRQVGKNWPRPGVGTGSSRAQIDSVSRSGVGLVRVWAEPATCKKQHRVEVTSTGRRASATLPRLQRGAAPSRPSRPRPSVRLLPRHGDTGPCLSERRRAPFAQRQGWFVLACLASRYAISRCREAPRGRRALCRPARRLETANVSPTRAQLSVISGAMRDV